MKTFTIKGKERTLTCNMRALMTYQRVTDLNPFDIESHTNEQKEMYDYIMGWCMLPAADQEEVQIEDILDSIDTLEKQNEFSTSVAAELERFYKSEPGDKDETDRHEVEGEQEDKEPGEPDKHAKNA